MSELTDLLRRIYLSEGFSPIDINKLTGTELEMLLKAREDGLIGHADKTWENQSEPRIVITTEGYMQIVWGDKGLEEYKVACQNKTKRDC